MKKAITPRMMASYLPFEASSAGLMAPNKDDRDALHLTHGGGIRRGGRLVVKLIIFTGL